ncbi:MAG TPA: UDP-N-acetylglucosamine diphosphorylase/glucosamine-1-phosphate N-acetyltransferase [Chloroflexi bacterium]|jgi:bifunctional UDP-N-acetylglucosamine pyrophosphorylase/glucosamine-1-phosphate N-acetyltransferase|nr:UDP-N-acetylglucosamine diphosphorylase/glucosamine-1-phosphate N-acetyltransferase [Chloroflexota bacterium]HCG30487.1 UDP-N-acetylglucosamine diphosphorylase/glucosamine-1-phosphate N-acetyltransferase [Chloroflexota bacterium]
MRSALPKVLHPIAGLPMIEHVVRAAEAIQPGQIVLTIGPTSASLREPYTDRADIAWQADPLGTGDAARAALPVLRDDIAWVMVIFGDHPIVDPVTLQQLIDQTRAAEPILSTVAVVLDEPGPYGRYRTTGNRIVAIVEAHEDDREYDGPVPVNSGMCLIRAGWLREHVGRLTRSPKGEYYLTELVALAALTEWPRDQVLLVRAEPEVAWGINDRTELARAERVIRERILRRHMLAGVTIVDPASTWIDADVTIGQDTRIEPGTTLRGRTTIGAGCRLGPQTVIEDAVLGDDVTIRASWIEQSEIGNGTDIGPYSHLRPGVRLAAHVHVGNYVEMKNARVGTGTQVGHVSYLGDAEIGERVNVGAGTITCNFDGQNKHQTTIGDDVFVGSDTMLVAPVELGDGSRTGAGSVVTKPVQPGQLVVGVPARPIRRTRRGAAADKPSE